MKSPFLGSVFLVLTLAGCGSSQSVTIYPKSMDEGVTFPSWEAAEEWMAQQTIEARKLAATLPTDYRRLVHAVVVASTVPDEHELASERRVFLTVLGEDADESLTGMLSESGRTVFPGSTNPGNTAEVDGEKVS